MGRKKKKTTKPWCWYCNREFEDEKILLQHQKAKHFKCHICHKKLYTGPGLQIHCMQVHKENIERVPNSIKGRDNISLEICGMDNIPEEDLIEHEKQKALYSGRSAQANDEDSNDSDNDSDHSTNQQQKQSKPPPPALPQQSPLPFAKQLPPGTITGPLPNMAPPIPPLPPMPPGAMPGPVPLMMMHPMMYQMNHMMMPPGMYQPPPLPPPPPSSSSSSSNTNQPPPPLMSQVLQPKPLMGFNATPTGSVAVNNNVSGQQHQPPPPPLLPPASLQQQTIKPLFPINDEISNNNTNNNNNRLTPPNNLPNKIESLAPGSKIVHPEDDISLEEFRASHHKYKYIPPQYSAPAVPNPLARIQSTSQQQQSFNGYPSPSVAQHHHHQHQTTSSPYHNGGY